MQLGTPQVRLQATLAEIVDLLQKHRVLETLTHRQESTRRDLLEHLQRQQNLVELQTRCKRLHPADLAFVLESLPFEDRALVWQQTPATSKGAVLVEVADVVREWLLDHTDRETLAEALRQLAPDDLAYLEGKVPDAAWYAASADLGAKDPAAKDVYAFPSDTVGHAMSPDLTAVREGLTAGGALADLASRPALSTHLDLVFVVDDRSTLRGVVPVADLIRQPQTTPLAEFMTTDPIVFATNEPMEDAVRAFERYDLVSAPVIDERGKLRGRITADAVIDAIRTAADRAALQSAGLGGEEDLFASVLDSARNRWPWLLVNLLTAFFASRVIGAFEHTIGQLVALATLMPIVASVGGNTGNQTVALVVRALALDQLQAGAFGHVFRKELQVSLLNGALWGSVMGVCALVLYHSAALGLVMMAAVLLNLIVAAAVGVVVPLALQRAGRDPAQGASVLLTFVTDSMGFFLFLGLAQLFLI